MRFDEAEFHFSPVLSQLVAKTNGEAGGAGFPAWLHATDMAAVIRLLVLKWLPPSVAAVMGAGLAENGLQKLCTFLVLVHDIGKLTPVFQARVLLALPAVRAPGKKGGAYLRGDGAQAAVRKRL